MSGVAFFNAEMSSAKYSGRWILWSLALLPLLSSPALADYQAGLEAYQRGDFDRAFEEWIRVANSEADTVHPAMRAETMYALGMLFWVGQGVLQDTGMAAYWLRQAAELNHAGAQAKLGYLYSSGQGVPQNDFEAFKWLQMAARQGDADAQYNLGVFYREGLGVEADGTRALEWFREAAANGDAVSAAIVAQYEAGVPVSGAGAASLPADDSPLSGEAGPEAGMAAAAVVNGSGVSPAGSAPDLNAGEQEGDAVLAEDWIRGRDPEHYTIQVIALREREKLENLVGKATGLAPWAIYRQSLKGRPLWVLVQGDYPNVEQARAAKRDFPADIQKPDRLWIRRFVMVQGLLH